MTDSVIELTIENLRKCFSAYGSQNQSLIKEAEKYIHGWHKNPDLPGMLWSLFENTNEDPNVRYLAIIHFKNLLKENWVVRKTDKSGGYPENFKKEVRSLMFNCLTQYQTKPFRPQIDDIIKHICATDFPNNYEDLANMFHENFGNVSKMIDNPENLLDDSTLVFMRTAKIILTERAPKRFGDPKATFYNIYVKYLENLHPLWDYLHQNTRNILSNANENNMDSVHKYLKLLRYVDMIYINLLCNGCLEMALDDSVLKILMLILERAGELANLCLEYGGKIGDLYKDLQKNLYAYLENLNNLQSRFKLLFKEHLTEYLTLIEAVIQKSECFQEENVLKIAVICLKSVLKTFEYYHEDARLPGKTLADKYEEMQEICRQKYYGFFTHARIESFLNEFLIKLLPRRKFLTQIINADEIETFIDTESERILDEGTLEIENTLFNLTLACTNELLTRFPDPAIILLHGLVDKIIDGSLNLPNEVQDGVFAMLGLLPMVYEKRNIDQNAYYDFLKAIKYLQTKSDDMNLAKRIPILISRWVKLYPIQVQAEILQHVVTIVKQINNFVIRYECCTCIKSLIKADERFRGFLNFVELAQALIPIVVELLGTIANSSTIWPLIELLALLFTKAQFASDQYNVTEPIQSPTMELILKSEDQLLMSALVDMLKVVIASFPPGTRLTATYIVALKFIHYHFERKNFSRSLLCLWSFLIKEYSPIQGKEVEEALNVLFKNYMSAYLDPSYPSELSTFINIIEEYILAELISVQDFPGIIELLTEKYEITINVTNLTPEVFDVKRSCLSLMSTLIIIYLNNNALGELNRFEKMLLFLLKDILNNYKDPEHFIRCLPGFKTSLLTLINRFIILNEEGFLKILEANNIDFTEFLDVWIQHMTILQTRHVKRLNCLSIFKLLPYITNLQFIQQKLYFLLKEIVHPQVILYIDTQGAPLPTHEETIYPVADRIREGVDSERKKAILKMQLYEDANLKELYIGALKQFIEKNNLSFDDLKAIIGDENTVETLIKITS